MAWRSDWRAVSGRFRLPARLSALAVLGLAVVVGFLVPSSVRPVGWEGVVAGWLHVARGSMGYRVAGMLVELGSERVVAGVAAGLAAGLAASGRGRVAVVGFAAVLLGAGGGELSKAVIGRRIGAGAALAYPSGHTAGATALATTILLVLAPGVASRLARACAAAAALGAGTAVGLAMVALGHHFPADVLGGLAFGVAVPVAVLGGFARDERPVAASAPDTDPAAVAVAVAVAPADTGGGAPLGPVGRRAVPAEQRFGVRDGAPVEEHAET